MDKNNTSQEELKVEIRLIDGQWQWMGRMNQETLRKLCDYADELSDEATGGTDE